MSTRCNIIIKNTYGDNEPGIQLYRHINGYPDGKCGVVAELERALEFAWELPRMEHDDFAAAIVRTWKKDGGNIYIDGNADLPKSLHVDIEYYYVIEADNVQGLWQVSVHRYIPDFYKGGAKSDEILWTGHIGDEYLK